MQAQQISQFFNELREVAVAQTRTLERIAVQTLDETVDVSDLTCRCMCDSNASA